MKTAKKFILAVTNVLAAEVIVWFANNLTNEKRGR